MFRTQCPLQGLEDKTSLELTKWQQREMSHLDSAGAVLYPWSRRDEQLINRHTDPWIGR